MTTTWDCCGQPLADTTTSCRPRRRAVRYGDETGTPACQPEDRPDWPQRCHDCAVADGGYHHAGCFAEECPACGGQRFGCPCLPVLRPVRSLLRDLRRRRRVDPGS
jgi:hypothetical protein